MADAWGGSWGASWLTYWQAGLPADHTVTDTDILMLPVDVVLAGQQPIIDRYREFDIRPMNRREKSTGRTAGPRRLEGGVPSFTVTSTKKGYD